MVELAGLEPASGQSVATPSTCLFTAWVFECKTGSVTHTFAPYLLSFARRSEHPARLSRKKFDARRLLSEVESKEGDAERGPHAAQKRPNSLELGSHSVLVFASYILVVIF